MFNNTTSPFSGMPPVVKNLLIINVICFVGGSLIFPRANDLFGVYYPDSPGFHIWQVITYMFMHGGIAHIFFNMFALFMFGPILEQVFGSKRFLNFYRSEEHTSELQSLMRISYAVFCLKTKIKSKIHIKT